jgi:predicted AlkP superfamily pyrophosphatase or phosphodiesterase
MTRYLLVISFDGLSSLDFEYLRNLPNFREFFEKASYSRKVYSVYPSLTYPAHATIVTGKYPKNHGIVNNTLFQPKRKSPDWYWQSKYIQGETLYDEALKKGMKVAALLWPVTGKSKITFNMPEVMANRSWQNQILVSLMNGSPYYQWTLNQKFGHLRHGVSQPDLDHFTHQSLLYTLQEKKPDLTLVHYTDVDSMRHYYGYHAPEAREALNRHDQRLGDILRSVRERGIEKESTIVVLGDHSSLDEDHVINLNILLKENGYLELDAKGRLKNYHAIVKSCDGSAYVYFNPKYPKNPREVKRLQHLLEVFKHNTGALEGIYSSADAIQWGADPQCVFLLEANLGYYFLDLFEGSVVETINPGDIGPVHHRTKAAHGYSPFKNDYTTVFMARGQGIREGVILPEMRLIDEGPTLARLLGLILPEVDGRVLDEILEL